MVCNGLFIRYFLNDSLKTEQLIGSFGGLFFVQSINTFVTYKGERIISTKFNICTQASILLDGEVVTSFSDGSREAEVFSPIYDRIKNFELSKPFWNFNIHDERLTDSNETPTNGRWDKAYLEPPNLLKLLKVMNSSGRIINDYDFRSGRIFTNVTEAWAKFHRKIDEADFPPYFESVMVARLMAEAALPMVGDPDTVAQIWRNYFATEADAKRIDAQMNLTRPIMGNNSPWLQAHGGSGSYGNLTVE